MRRRWRRGVLGGTVAVVGVGAIVDGLGSAAGTATAAEPTERCDSAVRPGPDRAGPFSLPAVGRQGH